MKKAKEEEIYILDIHTHNPNAGKHAIINYDLQSNIKPFVDDTVFGHQLGFWIKAILLDIYYWLVSFADPIKKGCFYSVGIHPWTALSYAILGKRKVLERLIFNKQILAIGETGLDKLSDAPIEGQIVLFVDHVEYSEVVEKPLIIHCVKMMPAIIAAKKKINPTQPWIWHGFRGKPEQAQQLLDHGFYISFGEYYSAEAMAIVPDDRLFLETDKSRVSIETLIERAAKVRGVEVEALRKTICENARNVFFKS